MSETDEDAALLRFREACKSLKREMLSRLKDAESQGRAPNWDEPWAAFPVLDPLRDPMVGCPEGVVYVPQALSVPEQRELARRAVHEYSQSENSNLSSIPPTQASLREKQSPSNPEPMKRVKISAGGELKPPAEGRLAGLRWTTLGWHYDWSGRRYHDGWRSPFPAYLSALSHKLTSTAPQLHGVSWTPFEPEAAIVNYYTPDTRMGPHRDDSELVFDRPILSLSLGSEAIFCIETKPPELEVFHRSCIDGNRAVKSPSDSKPFAFRVRSGDLIVMGGSSRVALHGVACVLPRSYARVPEAGGEASPEDDYAQGFLERGRINVSVRQVEGEGYMETFAARDPHQAALAARTSAA